MRPVYSGYVQSKPTGGPECEALERELETYYGVPHARVLNSATSALHASLVALGIGPGDEVLVPAYSMSASAAAVLHAGATPVFCDIGDTYTIDWEHARSVATASTRAIILVHLFGHHATVPDDIAIPVIHDAAQSPSLAPAASSGVRSASSDIWVYSLNQNKLITCGEGGYALAFDETLAHTIHLVRNHGESVSDRVLGYNYRMTEPQAKVARNEFRLLDARLIHRRVWANALTGIYGIRDPGNRDWFLFPVRCKPEERDAKAMQLKGKPGYVKPIYAHPYFRAHGWAEFSLPNTERIEASLVTINPLDDDE